MRRILGLLLACAACGDDASPADGPVADAPAAPTAADLLARIASCSDVVGGTFAPESGQPSTISICGYPQAVAFKADLSVDCDGKTTTKCNINTDPAYQNQTSATDSHGDPLDASTLPYVVLPSPSNRFDYTAHGIDLGQVVAVIYNGKLEYGVFGDMGPTSIIGEASYRMAELLGIDPDPSTGGIESGVAYIVFSGAEFRLTAIEDHDAAVSLGISRATALLSAP